MTTREEKAASLLAQGVSLSQVAIHSGLSRRKLYSLRRVSEFLARVDEFRRMYRARVEEYGISQVTERVRHKIVRHALLRKLIAGRSHDPRIRAYLNIEDGESAPWAGFMTLKLKGTDCDQMEFAIDTAAFDTFEDIEQAIAIELGQWKEKREITTTETELPPHLMALAKVLNREQIEAAKQKLIEAGKKRTIDVPAESAAEVAAEADTTK
jgi:hypothetical protein